MDAKEQLPAKKQLTELLLLLIVTAAAYLPVLFNFFVGDDFVHLEWLHKCIHDPSLLLRNFNHSWLEIPTTKFYRPLISVFMYTDYLVWRTNGLGFHLTNLIFHLINSLFVYLITIELVKVLPAEQQAASNDKSNRLSLSWPLLAALLFGLYPLHPEAVAWITGRVDTIVTTFYLGAVWFYMIWSGKKRAPYLILSMASMSLALLSKEMAITIPAVLAAWEVFRRGKEPLATIARATISHTLPFWILLAGYFVVRRLALGTFVGGYDDSLFFVANWSAFFKGWLQSIVITLLPFNREVISGHNIFAIGWLLALLCAGIGAVKAMFAPGHGRTVVFLKGVMLLSLLPVYKIFSISPDLESSRLVYLTSSFLCILLAFGITHLTNEKRAAKISENNDASIMQAARLAVPLLFLVCAFALLWRNNLVWRQAGLECTAIRQSLEQVCKPLPESAHLLLIGLPDQLHGAYICRNATPGAIQRPQFSKNLQDCVFLNSYDPVFPFGYLKQSLEENAGAVNIFCWNHDSQRLERVLLPQAADTDSKIKPGDEQSAPFHRFNADLIPGWTSEFAFISSVANEPRSDSDRALICFKNNVCRNFDGQNQIQAARITVEDRTGDIFALRAKPLWACGGRGQLTTNKRSLGQFQLVQAEKIMPFLDFANSGYLGSKGFLHLDSTHPSQTITCRRNDVANADHFTLEILRANLFLNPAEQNGTLPSNQKLKELTGEGKTGSLLLKKSDFPGPGLYQSRLWSADRTDKHLGVAGDHIIVVVE